MDQKISVVIPVYNEYGNIGILIKELLPIVDSLGGGEIVFVDDASTDSTADKIYKSYGTNKTNINLFRHIKRSGQSAALLTGIKSSLNDIIVTLDGDGQNDPKDIKKMFKEWKFHNNKLLLVIGNRINRRDTWSRRFASRLAHKMRKIVLKDATPDSGCGLKVFSKSLFLSLPYFDHIHRFLPALIRRQGGEVISLEVFHRQRSSGKSKYSNFQRFRVGLVDLFGVSWLIKRSSFPIKLIIDNNKKKNKE
tara:strand:+ start:628 stop:1377 length:750 start_codon:yes stop_codon:yes gene_type:complete